MNRVLTQARYVKSGMPEFYQRFDLLYLVVTECRLRRHKEGIPVRPGLTHPAK